jgi:proline iminopeptidase
MSKEDVLKPIEDPHIIRSGRLKVGNGHELYWVDWGNKSIQNPIFFLHGGPGSGFSERDFDKFDPKKQRVVFHDQRGSGRSTPFASIKHNTTADLLGDISKLKQHLGFTNVSLYGFSWGSTLALLYAIKHSNEIEKMLIGGIFLGRKVDADFFLRGGIVSHFPEAWERFAGAVPAKERADVGEYYRKKLFSGKPAERKKFAKEWMLYEASILRLDYRPEAAERNLQNFAAESLAYLEAHYILNDCFIPENYILKNVSKIQNTPTVIVQGRYDFVCAPSAAHDLHSALPNSILHMVMAGHSSSDTVAREVTRAYANLHLAPGALDK